MPEYVEVASEIVAELRSVCLGLPDAYEEQAWVGTRWCVRRKTFAHVLGVVPGYPPVLDRVVQTDRPVSVVTFRSSGAELDVLRHAGHPFFHAGWGRDVIGMVLDDGTDWAEVTELLTESYCVMAPQKLVALVERPDP